MRYKVEKELSIDDKYPLPNRRQIAHLLLPQLRSALVRCGIMLASLAGEEFCEKFSHGKFLGRFFQVQPPLMDLQEVRR